MNTLALATRLSRNVTSLAALLLLTITGPLTAQDAVHGYDLDRLAQALAQYSRIGSTVAHDEVSQEFEAFLRSEWNSSTEKYQEAYNVWWERFRADESGKLEARFHTLNSSYMQKVLYGDVEDQSSETREGVSLDTYAQIAVAVSRQPGADVDAVAKQFGLDGQEHFDRVNQAWIKAMSEDTTYAITQQYGALYQKYAGAGFAAEQEAKLADLLAARNEEEPTPDIDAPPTAEDYARELKSPEPSDRWYAARQLAFQCSRFKTFGKDAGVGLAEHCNEAAMKSEILPVVAELLRDFDDGNVGLASGILDLVIELELAKALGREKVDAALARAQARRAELWSEFEPIQDKNVPQKITLRGAIDSHDVSIDEFKRSLDDW